MNDIKYYEYQKNITKAENILKEVCEIVYAENKNIIDKHRAMVYAKVNNLISIEEYNLVIDSGII